MFYSTTGLSKETVQRLSLGRSILAGLLVVTVLTLSRDPVAPARTTVNADLNSSSRHLLQAQLSRVLQGPWIEHTDPVAGFALTLPDKWFRRVLNDSPEDSGGDEQQAGGYAVTYLSPLTSDDDTFADYIMVELLPGDATGFTANTRTERQNIKVDGITAIRERIELLEYPVADGDIDLVAYQTIVTRARYSLGIYAVGQRHESVALESLFSRVIETFKLPDFSRRFSRQITSADQFL